MRPKNKEKPAPKSDIIEMMRRVNAVYDLILLGFSRGQIIEYGQTKQGWNVEDNTVDTYIRAAKDRYAEASAIVRNEQLGLAISRLNHLLQKNMSIQDYKTALSAQKELNALLGLYAPKTAINVNINIAVIEQIVTLAEQRGIAASELFESMLNQLAKVDSADDNSK